MFVQTAGRCPKFNCVTNILLHEGRYCLMERHCLTDKSWFIKEGQNNYWAHISTPCGYPTLHEAIQAFRRYYNYFHFHLKPTFNWQKEGF